MKLLAAGAAALFAGGAFATTSAQAAINVKRHAGGEAKAVAGAMPLRFRVCGVTEGPGCEFVWDIYVKSKTWVSEANPEVGGTFDKVGKLTYSLHYEDGANAGCEVYVQKMGLFAPIVGGLYCEGEFIEELAEAKLLL